MIDVNQKTKDTGIPIEYKVETKRNYCYRYILPWKFKDGDPHVVVVRRRKHPCGVKGMFQWVMSDNGILAKKFKLKEKDMVMLTRLYYFSERKKRIFERMLDMNPFQFFWSLVRFSCIFDEVEKEFGDKE